MEGYKSKHIPSTWEKRLQIEEIGLSLRNKPKLRLPANLPEPSNKLSSNLFQYEQCK